MKKSYEKMQLRVWNYSEDVVRTSNPVCASLDLNNFSADNGKTAFNGDSFEEGGFACGW